MGKLKWKAVSGLVLMLLLTSMISSAFIFQPTKADGTDYIVKAGAEPDSTSTCSQRKLAMTSDGKLDVVYHRKDANGILQIYHAESADEGITWTEEQITDAVEDQCFPALAVDSNDNLHLVWEYGPEGYEIVPYVYYRKKTTTWQTPELVASYAITPAIAVDSNDNVHVVYGTFVHYGEARGARWRMRTPTGWQPEEIVSSINLRYQRYPAIAIDGNNDVHVVWDHAPGPNYDTHYRKRTSSGWGLESEIFSDSATSTEGSIAIDSENNVHVVVQYRLGSGGYSIKYREFTTSWQSVENLEGPTIYPQRFPSIAIDGKDQIHVVWSGQHSDSPTIYQLRYRSYVTSWQPINKLTSSTSNNQAYPSLIWALHPTVGGVKTNRPEEGYFSIWMDGTTIKYWKRAYSFGFPLDEPWTISRRFGRYSYNKEGNPIGYHLGEDVLRNFEAPVCAPADGVVKHNAKRTGYGYVVIIEQELMDGTFVCSVLGHLRQEGRAPVGSTVTKGQIVGYLSSIPEEHGYTSIHLHFGIRKGQYSEELDSDGKWRYRGYGPIDIVGSWYSPSAFTEYYNLNKENPPSYDLTINTEGGGAAASSTSVFALTYMTKMSLFSSLPWFQYWVGTDNDILNPTTVTMSLDRVVAEVCLSEPPPPRPEPWELAIDLIGADYSFGGGKGWSWNPVTQSWAGGRWLDATEVEAGYHFFNVESGLVEFGKGIDCSGLVFWAYNKAWGAKPGRMLTPITQESTKENTNPINEEGAQDQYWRNCEIDSTFMPINVKNQLQPSDCLFFDTGAAGDPDHVAMYVGNFLYEGRWYNVTHASGYAGKVTPAWYDPVTGTLKTENQAKTVNQTLPVNYYGRPVHQIHYRIARNMFSYTTGSPIDLIVTDPDGVVITKETGEVAGMSYAELDLDGDGELDDEVNVWEPKAGDYRVTVIPEPGALPTDGFTLKASGCNSTVLLTDCAQISEVPTDPYVLTRNETTIMLRNINIAVTNITPSKNVVGQGYSSSINVTVQNQGNLAETTNVTLYANTTTISTLSNINLTSGSSVTIPFTWSTAGSAKGNYTIAANVTQVSGETYTADNTKTFGIVTVTIQGDIDGNRIVNVFDLYALGKAYSSSPGQPSWNTCCDINDDRFVDNYDLAVVSENHGRS